MPYFDQWRMMEVQETEGNAWSSSDITWCFCLFQWLDFWAHYCVIDHVFSREELELVGHVVTLRGSAEMLMVIARP